MDVEIKLLINPFCGLRPQTNSQQLRQSPCRPETTQRTPKANSTSSPETSSAGLHPLLPGLTLGVTQVPPVWWEAVPCGKQAAVGE